MFSAVNQLDQPDSLLYCMGDHRNHSSFYKIDLEMLNHLLVRYPRAIFH